MNGPNNGEQVTTQRRQEMPKKIYKPEEIIHKLREAEVRLSQGATVAEVLRALGISEVTYYRWRKE